MNGWLRWSEFSCNLHEYTWLVERMLADDCLIQTGQGKCLASHLLLIGSNEFVHVSDQIHGQWFSFTGHTSLTLSTNVRKIRQIRLSLFMLNRRLIFALLHFRLIWNKYVRLYGPHVHTTPYFCTAHPNIFIGQTWLNLGCPKFARTVWYGSVSSV